MDQHKLKLNQWRRRKQRIRKKVKGDPDRPRLSVFRSLRHTYAQIIDDVNGMTLVSASTRSKELAGKVGYGGNIEAAQKIGEMIARKALEVGIRQVRFDRSGYQYHGRIKALAEAARKAGLGF